jgi:hypothetical protein
MRRSAWALYKRCMCEGHTVINLLMATESYSSSHSHLQVPIREGPPPPPHPPGGQTCGDMRAYKQGFRENQAGQKWRYGEHMCLCETFGHIGEQMRGYEGHSCMSTRDTHAAHAQEFIRGHICELSSQAGICGSHMQRWYWGHTCIWEAEIKGWDESTHCGNMAPLQVSIYRFVLITL